MSLKLYEFTRITKNGTKNHGVEVMGEEWGGGAKLKILTMFFHVSEYLRKL